MNLKDKILNLWEQTSYTSSDRDIFEEFKQALNSGKIRSAEKIEGKWVVNTWVKKGILLGFRMGTLVKMPISDTKSFIEKDTYPQREFSLEDGIRMVPGGSSVREGAYIAKSVVMMPPMYINVGSYVDEGTLIDSHALVGSCAQIGKHVHLSAAAQIGGVIEPIGASPVIIEDNVFIGGNCGIYEGVIVKEKAILAAGVILTAGTPVFDAVNNKFLERKEGEPLTIPERAVIVSGTRPLKSNKDFSVYCPIIIKYRDEKTEASVTLESILR